MHGIEADAGLIMPGVDHINRTGGVVAGALPLLYTMAEGIVTGVTPRVPEPAVPEPARPASGTRRSRLLGAVGYGSHPYPNGRRSEPNTHLGRRRGRRSGRPRVGRVRRVGL